MTITQEQQNMEFNARSKALDVAVAVTARAGVQGQAVDLTAAATEAYDFIVSGLLAPPAPEPAPETLFDDEEAPNG